MFFENAEMYLC